MARTLFFLALIAAPISTVTFATPADIEGSQDHPLVSRYPGTHIIYYKVTEFDQINTFTGKSTVNEKTNRYVTPKQTLEGKITTIGYKSDATLPFLQAARNFRSGLERAGFNVGFYCESIESCGVGFSNDYIDSLPGVFADGAFKKLFISSFRPSYITGKLKKSGGDAYVSALVSESDIDASRQFVILTIIEVKSMQDNLVSVDANYLSQSIQNDGKAVLSGIFFDTDKASIKPDSSAALNAIADYLNKNRSVKVFVVGHTDTSGDYAHNVDLSGQRAKAVAEALANNFKVDKSRLHAVGVGPVAPAGSNATEEGKAKNRRVEMVLD